MIRAAVAAVFICLASAQAPVVAAQEPAVHLAPNGIAHDCSIDVTEVLTDWIGSIPDGSTLQLARRGCYRIDETLRVRDHSGLVFDGNGATLRAGTEGDLERRHLRFYGGSDLVVRDLTVRGSMPNTRPGPEDYREGRAFQHGIELRGVTRATLERVRVVDVYGDFVYVGPGAGGVWSTDVVVTSSRFAGSGRQGISVTAGERITLTDNVIRGVALSIFNLEPNNDREGARVIRIENNVTGRAGSFWFSSQGTGSVGDVAIVSNEMKTTTSGLLWVIGPEGGVAGPVTIEHNRLRVGDALYPTTPIGAFYFDGCAGVTITDNRATFPTTARVDAVEVRNCQNVVVDRNAFPGAGELLVDNTGAPSPSN